jgi:hypothetical protein
MTAANLQNDTIGNLVKKLQALPRQGGLKLPDDTTLSSQPETVRASAYTIIAIETNHGEVFGSFTSTPWLLRDDDDESIAAPDDSSLDEGDPHDVDHPATRLSNPFGQSFYVQCHKEWSNARAGGQILSQFCRFLRQSLEPQMGPVDVNDTDAQEREAKVQRLHNRTQAVVSDLIDLLTDCDRECVHFALGVAPDPNASLNKKFERFRNPGFNATALSSSLLKRENALLHRTVDSPLGGTNEEVAFPFSLMRTIGNYNLPHYTHEPDDPLDAPVEPDPHEPVDLVPRDASRENEGTNEGAPNHENEGARVERNEGARTGTHLKRGAPPTFKSSFGRKITVSKKDTMNFAEVMKQDDRDPAVDAMEKEIRDHVPGSRWQIYSRAQMRQMGYTGRIIMAVWSLKRKRNPFGIITEHSDNVPTGHSRTGYIILWFAGSPLIWSFKLQTTIALLTTEAEYPALSSALRDVIYVMQLLEGLILFHVKIPVSTPTVRCKVFQLQMTVAFSTTAAECIALSTALRDVIYVMRLLNELIISFGINTPMQVPTVRCKVLADNVGAIELARCPKLRPRTEHIAIQYHRFRTHVAKKWITIPLVTTTAQVAGIATKPLPRDQFKYIYTNDSLVVPSNSRPRGSVGL